MWGFNTAASLENKRESILGQFNKAIESLYSLNEDIDSASNTCSQRVFELSETIEQERLEHSKLQDQKEKNINTIKKMEQFVV